MLKYLGGGYIPGVPARDLTAEEAKRYAAIIEEQERASGLKLYEKVTKPEKGAPAGDKE
jgi:hypothetical protein